MQTQPNIAKLSDEQIQAAQFDLLRVGQEEYRTLRGIFGATQHQSIPFDEYYVPRLTRLGLIQAEGNGWIATPKGECCIAVHDYITGDTP